MGLKGFIPFLSILMMTTLVALIVVEAEDAQGLVEIDQDVVIDHDASWADETFRLHGNLTILGGYILTLEDAVVEVVGQDNASNWVDVRLGGRLHAVGSTIRGTPFSITILMDGLAYMEDCTVENAWAGNTSDGIKLGGHAKLVRTNVTGHLGGRGINVTGTLEAIGCTFSDQGDVTVLFKDPSREGDSSLVNSTFKHPSASDNTTFGVAVLWPSTLAVDQGLTVTGCVFTGLDVGVYAEIGSPRVWVNISTSQFISCDQGYSVHGNNAVTSFVGCSIGGVGSVGLFVEVPSSIDDPLVITVRDLTISGYNDGVYITGPVMEFVPVLENVSITECVNGVRVRGSTVLVEDSLVLECGVCFYVEHKARIEVRRTEHTYQSAEIAPGHQAAVVAFSTVHVGSCRWQNGPNITEGELVLYGDDGVELTRLDLTDLEPVEVVVWSLTRFNKLGRLNVVPARLVDRVRFEAASFSIYEADPQDVEVVDHLPPEVEVLSPEDGEWLASTEVEVRGHVSDRGSGVDMVSVSPWAGEWVRTTVFEDGIWTVSFDTGMDGPFSVTVEAVDLTGGSAIAKVGNLTVDTTFPTLEVESEVVVVPFTWLNITGLTEPHAFVQAQATDMPPDSPFACTGNMTTGEDGRFDIYLCMPEGWHNVSVRSTDRAGNEANIIIRVGMDPRYPTLLVETPEQGSWHNVTTVRVSGEFSDQGISSWVKCWVEGELLDVVSGDFEVTLELPEGAHVITVHVQDEAGNVRVVERAFQVDTTPPRLRIVTPSEERFFTEESRIEMQGDVSDANLDVVTMNGKELTVVRDIITASLLIADGENVFVVTAVDMAGNVVNRTITIIKDQTPPTYTFEVTLPGGEILDIEGVAYARYNGEGTPRLELSFQVSENSTVTASGGIGQVTGEGVLAMSLPLGEGGNSFTFNVVDESGNAANPSSYTIVLDTTPPAFLMTDPRGEVETRDPVYRILGRVEEGSTLTVNGGLVEVNADGSFSFQVDLEVGENVFLMEAKDVVGLTSDLRVVIVRKEQEDEGPAAGAMVTMLCLVTAAAATRTVLRRRL